MNSLKLETIGVDKYDRNDHQAGRLYTISHKGD